MVDIELPAMLSEWLACSGASSLYFSPIVGTHFATKSAGYFLHLHGEGECELDKRYDW